MLSTHRSSLGTDSGSPPRPGPIEPCLVPSAAPAGWGDWQADLTLDGTLAEVERITGALCAQKLAALLADGGIGAAGLSGGQNAGLGAVAPLVGLSMPTQADAGAALAAGLGLLAEGALPQAAAEFLRALAEPSLRGAAVQGLAVTLVAAGHPREALALAEVLDAAGAGHPAVPALAGWCASLTGDAALTRRYMARAARAARSNAAHAAILRFAQRTLLIQSFGS